MSQPEITSPGNVRLIRRLVRTYLAPYTGQLIITVFFMLIAAAATAGFAKLLQPVLDKGLIAVQEGEGLEDIWPLGLSVFGVFFISGLATYIHVIKMNKISQSIVADIQRDVFSHFMTMDLAFFHKYPSGQLVSRIINDVNVMRAAVSDSVTGIGKNLFTLFFLLGVMFWQDFKLALMTLVIFPPAIILITLIGRRLRRVSHSIQSENARLMETLIGIFQGIRQVQAYGMEKEETKRAGGAVTSVRNLNIKSVRIGNLSTPINEIMVGIVIASVIVYGAYEIADGNLTPGKLISFIAAFALAYEPMKKLAKLNNSLQVGLGAADRIMAMVDMPPSIKDKSRAKSFSAKKCTIAFNNVEFSYAESEGEYALQGVSFRAEPNKVTALVGASGSGKTTILNLIPRFYDVQSGEVTLNGENIQNIKMKDLRNHIALVSQDITIFDDTVAANIGYGKIGSTEKEIRKAAKDAAAEEFINELPQGYDTRLGENGVKLSGGQKQRIAIARAILRNAPILLLDEATSALDNESEKLIQATLARLEKGRTTLVIAHRLSTIQAADKIIVLDDGKIVEEGAHTSLMKKKGVYKRLYESGLKS